MAKFVGVSRPGYELDGKHIAAALERTARRRADPGRGAGAGDLVDRLPQACRGRTGPIWYLVPDGVVQYVVQAPAVPPPSRSPRQDGDAMTASAEAIQMATVAAPAAAAKLADDVVVIDVSGQLVITDCFVIASASNERQVNAIVDEVEEKMRLAGYKPARREGAREGRWMLLDYVDIVVHIQHQDERNFYALDRLWRDCPVVPVDLDAATRGAAAMRVRTAGDAAARADRVQRRQPDAGPARHRSDRPRPRPGRRRRRGAGQAATAARSCPRTCAAPGHRGRARGARRGCRCTSTPGCARRTWATGRA